PFVGASRHDNHGERVVQGQRLMQATTDVFLGWARNPVTGVDFYWRQLRDMKGGIDLETVKEEGLVRYAALCATVLARAHA
ncbi:MAG: DUF2252 family protein, partial [Myxococcales bacterium]